MLILSMHSPLLVNTGSSMSDRQQEGVYLQVGVYQQVGSINRWGSINMWGQSRLFTKMQELHVGHVVFHKRHKALL